MNVARAFGIAFCGLAATAASLAAGCGGGGQTSSPSQALPPPLATATPVTSAQGKATVALSIVIPAAGATSSVVRRPRYVSPSTNSLSFAQNGSVTTVVALTPTSPNCTTGNGGVRTCTVNVNATAGQNQSFTVKTFASSNGTGTPLSVQTIVATIVANISNPLTFVLNGVVASLTAAFAVPSLPYGLAGSTTLTVNAKDASGNIIVGPGNYATASGAALTITLTNADNSGATALTHSSLTQPGAADGFTYAGGPLNGDTVTASAPGVTSAAASIAFTCNPTPATSALYVDGVFTNPGYGLYPLSLSGASPPPSNVVDPPGILGYPIAVDADGRAYTRSGSVSNIGIPSAGAAVEEFCPQATGVAAVPYRSIVATGAIAVDPARHLYVLYQGGSGSLLEFAPDAGTPGVVPSTAPTTVPIRTIAGSNTEIPDAGISGYAATNSNFYFNAYNELLSFSSTQTGNVAPTLVAADTAPGLLNPESVAVDKSGNVYVLYQSDYLVPQPPAATYNALYITLPAVAEYTPQGVVSRVISGTNTDMGDANGIAADGVGNVWVSSSIEYTGETGFHPQIESFNSSATGDASPTARFEMIGETSPLGSGISLDLQQMAIDPTTANIYICDSAGYGVIVFNSVGNYLGQISPSVGGLGAAYGIAFNASGSFVVQSGPLLNGSTTYGSAQLRFYPAGTGTTGAATPAPTKVVNLGSYDYPAPIAVDGSGNVYELSGENGALISADSPLGDSWTYTVAEFAAGASGNATPISTFYDPANMDITALTLGGIGVDSSGDVLVGNTASNVVYLYHAGTSGSPVSPTSGYQDFAPSTYFLRSLATDPAGNVYAASFSGATITEFAAGTSTVLRTIAGPHTRILHPQGIAVDSSDNIYLGNQYGTTLAIFGPTQSGDVTPQRTVGAVGPDASSDYQYMAIGPGDPPATAAQSIPTQRAAAAVARRAAARHEALATISAQATARCAAIRKVPPPQGFARASAPTANCEPGLINAVHH